MPKLAATAATNAAATRRSKRRNNPLPRQAPGRGALAANLAEIKGGLALRSTLGKPRARMSTKTQSWSPVAVRLQPSARDYNFSALNHSHDGGNEKHSPHGRWQLRRILPVASRERPDQGRAARFASRRRQSRSGSAQKSANALPMLPSAGNSSSCTESQK